MMDKQLREAAQKTVDYLYKIEGDCPPELYKAIDMLRQLINEEFKPEKQLSSQFIFDIISPAFHSYGNRERIAELEELKRIDWIEYKENGEPTVDANDMVITELDTIISNIKELNREVES